MSLIQQNRISSTDLALIQNQLVSDNFGNKNDIAELHIFNDKGELLKSLNNFSNYKPNAEFGLLNNTFQAIDIEPKDDLHENGFSEGTYQLHYNFLRKISLNKLFIQQISSDKTELIVSSSELLNEDIEKIYDRIKSNFEDLNYIKNILINFGQNNISLITNVALDTNADIYKLIIKIYEPIPKKIGIKSLCFICEEVIQTNIIEVTLTVDKVKPVIPNLSSANFDLMLDDKASYSTSYSNNSDLKALLSNNDVTNSELRRSSVKINVNYEKFEDFIHYSSAVQRIQNFILKIKKIENYNNQKLLGKGNIISINSKINEIVSNLDDYELFLYKSNSIKAYPKLNNNLLLSNSFTVIQWLGSIMVEGSYTGILRDANFYDERNKDSLINNLPTYLIVDSQHKPFIVFCNMVGQHFDLIWLYSNKYSTIYEANNNMGLGISPDIVEHLLKSFGVKLYNSLSNVDVTDSSHKTYNKEIYKRIYHNLPQLNKSKGTRNGLTQLMNIFGVPDTLYRINEYGSIIKDKNSKEHIEPIFNYALTSNRNCDIMIPIKSVNSNEIPVTIMFRLKLKSKPVPLIYSVGDFSVVDFSSSSFFVEKTVSFYNETLATLKHNGIAEVLIKVETFDDSPSIIYLENIGGTPSPKIVFNAYNREWHSFSLTRIVSTNIVYELSVGTHINGKIDIQKCSIVIYSNNIAEIYNQLSTFSIGKDLDFSLQQFITYSEKISEETFKTHILNPTSIQGNTLTSFSDTMTKNLPFGTDLKKDNHINVINNPTTPSSLSYETNYEQIYFNSPNVITQKRTSDTIKIVDKTYYKKVLSNFIKIEQNKNENFNDHTFLDVVFSPTFEQDDDIINTLGYFNLDDYIGNPLEGESSQYINLKELNSIYLKRLVGKYDIKDYMNIIQYVDNSLFKMITDFVPVSSNTSTGIMIRQNILNRNKFKRVSAETIIVNGLDLSFTEVSIDNISQNIIKDFYINISKDFSEFNYNPFFKTLTKDSKALFNYSIYNQNITYLRDIFSTFNTSINNLKYNGLKVKSDRLNQYTEGDISFGKSLNISSYTNKVALFTDVSNNDIFFKKSTIQLKYLVDKKGNLTDLNKTNKNFYDIQELFYRDDKTVISLFDNLKYTNQKSLDGSKTIYSSGYDYNNVLYFSNSDRFFNFTQLDNTILTTFRYYQSTDIDITNLKYVYNLFNAKDIDIQTKFMVGNQSQGIFSKYIIPENGDYEFNVNVAMVIDTTNNDLEFKYRLSTYKNYVSDESLVDSVMYTFNPSEVYYDADGNPTNFDQNNSVVKPLEVPILGNDTMKAFNTYWSNSKNSITSLGIIIPYRADRTWVWNGKVLVDEDFKNYRIYVSDDSEKISTGKLYEFIGKTGIVEKLQDVYLDFKEQTVDMKLPSSIYGSVNADGFLEKQGRGLVIPDSSLKNTTISNSFIKGDNVLFVLELLYSNDKTINTIRLLKASSIYSVKNNYSIRLNQNESLITSLSETSIIFNKKLISFLDKGIFDATSSTLFKSYGNINESFNIEIGDIIILKDGKSNAKYYMEISEIKRITNNIQLNFTNELPTFVLKENITECLIVNKTKDETKIVINFDKSKGQTSYGFIIPSNIDPLFLSNIDIITKEVKLKLLNDFSLNKNIL